MRGGGGGGAEVLRTIHFNKKVGGIKKHYIFSKKVRGYSPSYSCAPVFDTKIDVCVILIRIKILRIQTLCVCSMWFAKM